MPYTLTPIGNSYSCNPTSGGNVTTDFQITPVNVGDTYQWYIDGVLQPGETGSLFTTPVTPLSRAKLGVYKALVTPLVGSPEFTEEKSIINGVDVMVPEIETEDPEAPLGMCSVNPQPIVLRLVGAAEPGATYLWNSSETTTEIAPDYPDNFNVTSTSPNNSCFQGSNTIIIAEHDDGVPPTLDSNPGGDTQMVPGETVVLESDRSVSWYRSTKSVGPFLFIGRGASMPVTQGGFYKVKDACGHFSTVFHLLELGTVKLRFSLSKVGDDYIKVSVVDVLRSLPIATLGLFHRENIEIKLFGYGTRFTSQDYILTVSNKIEAATGYMNAWAINYTPETCMTYLQGVINS
jgi:hypothetical protein